uniref:Uncharacterized protein n=1 Tax=Triticum urartu TaxID=4572 RepID=A0A8R7UG60_TRIUA
MSFLTRRTSPACRSPSSVACSPAAAAVILCRRQRALPHLRADLPWDASERSSTATLASDRPVPITPKTSRPSPSPASSCFCVRAREENEPRAKPRAFPLLR